GLSSPSRFPTCAGPAAVHGARTGSPLACAGRQRGPSRHLAAGGVAPVPGATHQPERVLRRPLPEYAQPTARLRKGRGRWSECCRAAAARGFGPALTLGAAAVILAHNHPSGDPTPSPEDLTVTHHLQEAGRLLGVEVLDHLVVCAERFRSLRESGAL